MKMAGAWKLAALLLCSSSLVEAKKTAAPNDAADLTADHTKQEPNAVKLAAWLNTLEGGSFNTKQEVRAVNDVSDGSKPFYGIFAKEFIARGEVLAEIPWHVIITDKESDPSLSENDFEGAVLKCGTARNLAKEMKRVETLGSYVEDASSTTKYGPYIQYLLDQPSGVLASTWSHGGISMFHDVLGGREQSIPPLYAATWLTDDWYRECNGDPNDELAAKAAMVVVSRADDDLLVPVYDMYNHRNGKYYNTKMEPTRGVGYKITARKNIQPGDQVYNSYNLCDTCGGRKDGYGTPEIFRDYGFIEEFPQRWNFEEQELMYDLYEKKAGEIHVAWRPKKLTEEEDIKESKEFFMLELRRLMKLRKVIWRLNFKDGKPSIKESEWNSIWEFHDATVNSMTHAYNDLVEDESEKLPIDKESCTSDGVCGFNYFDDLEWRQDATKYNRQTCHNQEVMTFPDYWMMEGLKTHYQQLNFAFRASDGDICMDLEDTVQICSSYRPHYHEYSSHFAARFIDNVKRVVFVGGGDSMMLHEVLKYPSLEKVVGLELDQTVVRKSFKYFNTQAHFDNDKVEWWFGDATKSLLLLPEDYWGSFDLVIIDLSETVMAFSVTEKLDVFDALALLLNPDGVMVKNEHYMETMSKSFDYTLQVYLEQNPKICSQCMIFGSNKADFFHKPVVEHGVETLLLPPVADLEDGYDFFHDFRKNNATREGKCDVDTDTKPETTKRAGLLHVLDAENVGVKLDQKTVEKIMVAAAKAEGFTKITPSTVDGLETSKAITKPGAQDSTMVTVVFEEGYASARIWPEDKYIAIDVGVWGSFQNGDKLRTRIGQDLKAETESFFRIVVGGMFGSSTWEVDKDIIGPQIVQQRNCDVTNVKKGGDAGSTAKSIIYEEMVNFMAVEKATVVVLCGAEGTACPGMDVLGDDPMVGKVVPVWTCPEVAAGVSFDKMIECEDQVLATLTEARGHAGDGIEVILLDESAPYEMGQILDSILSIEFHRDMLVSENEHYMVSLAPKLESEDWRKNLLEHYRLEELYDPIKLTKMEITVSGATMELVILSNDHETGFKRYKSLEEKLVAALSEVDAEASAEVVAVTGGMFLFQEDYDPRYYPHDDYDPKPGLDQWAAQKPLGRKAVVQFDKPEEGTALDAKSFVSLIDSIAEKDLYQFEVYTTVGEGAVVVSDTDAGSLVATWDGRDHVDLNIFMHDDSEEVIEAFVKEFSTLAEGKLNMGLRDDFPRGTGRVMNFKSDLSYAGLSSITEREPYVDLDKL
eukprot:CAMPEP_0116103254 /NCGR_PEP_ID=MMETSP0327-20121206/13784_1 /TAXON_ID=44447 /ORGANISM="Pseudo-nitzschia delicatissima, Strain B596" /LENGTH=1264 /DNA_ID=CAMNT_0003595347 /DNA_START=128 /DNA_END=3922 /DNA_ORIENTATION=-